MNFYESRYKNKSNDASNSTGRETNSLRKVDGNITDSCNRGRRKYLHTYLHKDTYTYRRGRWKGEGAAVHIRANWCFFYLNFVLRVRSNRRRKFIGNEARSLQPDVARCEKFEGNDVSSKDLNSTIHHRIFLTYQRLSEACVVWKSHVFSPM